jgi:hypothetical protein
VVDEQTPHHPGRHGEEVSAVAESRATQVHQLEVRLVNQRRGVQRRARIVMPKPEMGDAPQVVVQQGHELVQRFPVSLAPALQQLGDVWRCGRYWHRCGLRAFWKRH